MPQKVTKTMVVQRVEDQGDRKLAYGADMHYHVIAAPNDNVQIGDTIEYEPYGYNFGWFLRICTPGS